ncbi:MAG TPA: Gfo/Idh/MocA family oxidoreductase [Anaerolineales bacterium]
MLTKRLKIGVIGVGRMGQHHCRVYSNLRNVDFVGIYDPNSEATDSFSKNYDVTAFGQLDDLLSRVEAVTVATPTPNHYDTVMQCLQHGVHVLIEKPIAETLEQAECIVELAETSGLVVQVGHIERFNPAYRELKNVLDGMPVLAVNFRRLSPYLGSNKDVDVILDLMTHDVDLCLDMSCRPPDRIMAYGKTVFSDTLDHAVAHLVYEDGPLYTITASRVTEHKVRRIDVTTSDAYLECDLLNKTISVHRRSLGEYLNQNKGVKYRQESLEEKILVPTSEPLYLELQHFVDCVLFGQSCLVGVQEGLQTLKIVTMVRDLALSQNTGSNSISLTVASDNS